ncbi:fibronectin type III domain-containing protein [Streptomyces albidoflavus]|uniref:fibronectin type III domain-containing protein n=1 Tax=Streptomyces albidoflavus TaxID=1886 RepID=UPI0033323B00
MSETPTPSAGGKSVTLPGIGKVKRQHVLIGAALVAGIVGYAWWRNGQAGYEDVPAYTDEDVQADGVTLTPGGAAGGSANSGGGSHNDGGVPATDAEWVRAAVELVSSGFDVGAVQAALGRYITRQPLDAQQESIVRAAIGALGYPPGGAYPIDKVPTPTPSALTEPKGLKQTASTATSVTIAWTPVAGANGYRIYRSGVSQNVGHSMDALALVGGLEPGTSYKFTVRALDAAGKTGPASSAVTAKTASAKLAAPTGLTVTTTKTTAVLKWKAVPGATEYRVYRAGVAQNITSSKDTTATVGGLKANTGYVFHVRALAGTTTGPASAKKSAKTKK